MLAYEESKKLNSEEFYIIRLICDGINFEDDFFENIKNVELKEEDKNDFQLRVLFSIDFVLLVFIFLIFFAKTL